MFDTQTQRKIRTNYTLRTALELIEKIGGNTYIVGGAVRDLLMGNIDEIHDIDIATNVSMEVLCNQFETHDIGKNKDFGIVVIRYGGIDFEVAHFRSDGQYSDNRHPDQVTFVTTIEEDLARRDFTINAMAWDGKQIIDPYGGQLDIKSGIVRFVGSPEERIKEDGLRVLRAYRFAARYRFDIEGEKWMRGFDFTHISQERITEEIRKTASYGGYALAFFMDRTERNDVITIAEIQRETGSHQVKHHPEGNVFQHIIHCLSVSESKDYLTNLAILFHDIGKTYTKKTRLGHEVYHGHDIVGATNMSVIGARMKLSNDEIETIKYICNWHMFWRQLPQMKVSKLLEVTLHKDYEILCAVTKADEMSRLYLGDINKRTKVRTDIETKKAFVEDKLDYDNKVKSFDIAKKILMFRTDVQGKEIGVLKKAAIEMLVDKRFESTTEEVTTFIFNYKINGEEINQDVPPSSS